MPAVHKKSLPVDMDPRSFLLQYGQKKFYGSCAYQLSPSLGCNPACRCRGIDLTKQSCHYDGDSYRRLLWTPADEVDDVCPAIEQYLSNDFHMYVFKVRRCTRLRNHDWTECPFAHPGEKARRRDPRRHRYSGTPCPEFRKGSCKKGDACEFAHGVFECWLHPSRYRTQSCNDGENCKRRVCFFAHTPNQLRQPLSSPSDFSTPVPLLYESSATQVLPAEHGSSVGGNNLVTSGCCGWDTEFGFSSPTSTLFRNLCSPPPSPLKTACTDSAGSQRSVHHQHNSFSSRLFKACMQSADIESLSGQFSDMNLTGFKEDPRTQSLGQAFRLPAALGGSGNHRTPRATVLYSGGTASIAELRGRLDLGSSKENSEQQLPDLGWVTDLIR